MNLKKGILIIVATGLWLLLGAWFAFSLMLQLFLPADKLIGLWFCLNVFLCYSVGLTVIIIQISDRISPADRQFLDLEDLYTKAAVSIAIIAGLVSFAIYSYIMPTGPHIAPYMSALISPFMLIFRSYIVVRWIVEGFRD